MFDLRAIITWAAVAAPFLTGFVLRGEPVNLFIAYLYLPFVFVAGAVMMRFRLPADLLLFIAALAIHSAVSLTMSGYGLSPALQQIVGISAFLFTSYFVFAVNGFDVFRVFRTYSRIAWLAVLVGLVQIAAFLLAIPTGYDFSGFIPASHVNLNEMGIIRVQSFLPEPAVFGLLLTPLIFVALQNLTSATPLFIGRWKSAAVLFVTVWTFSAVAYLGIAVSLALLAVNRGNRQKLAWAAGAAAAVFLAYATVPDIQVRVDDTLALWLHPNLATANFSSLTLYNNSVVASRSLSESGFLGSGIGSHAASFARHSLLHGLVGLSHEVRLLNRNDANSLLLRAASELGAPGLIAIGLFLWRFHVSRPSARRSAMPPGPEQHLWVVSNAVLAFMLLCLVRSGHYFIFGLPLFALMYLYAGRLHALAFGYAQPEIAAAVPLRPLAPAWPVRAAANSPGSPPA